MNAQSKKPVRLDLTTLRADLDAIAGVLVVPATIGEFWMIAYLLFRGINQTAFASGTVGVNASQVLDPVALFGSLGVTVLDGGPTLNPSTFDLLAAIHALPTEDVILNASLEVRGGSWSGQWGSGTMPSSVPSAQVRGRISPSPCSDTVRSSPPDVMV